MRHLQPLLLDVARERLEHVLGLVLDELRRELDRRYLDQLVHRCLFELLPHAFLFASSQLRLDGRAQPRQVRVFADLLGELVVQGG